MFRIEFNCWVRRKYETENLDQIYTNNNNYYVLYRLNTVQMRFISEIKFIVYTAYLS